MQRLFTMKVTETYSSTYEVYANNIYDALNIADRKAAMDNTFTNPEHRDSRTIEQED